jgi:tetratricopeptide (TPR) repeat protein
MTMTNANLAALNQEELFQTALDSGAGGDSDMAIASLKEAAGRADATAMTHYVLGAEQAQAGRYDHAIEAMEAALALDPGLHVARLQLGMLYLGRQDAERGVEVLALLERLDAFHPLRHFASGLVSLTRGDPAAALAALEQGIGLNFDYPTLSVDMRRVATEIVGQGVADAAPPAPEPTAVPVADEGGQHVLLSAYTSNRSY